MKLPSLLLLSRINSVVVCWVAGARSILGARSGLYYSNPKKLIAYSSVSHIGWLSASIVSSTSIIYIAVYGVLIRIVALLIDALNTNSLLMQTYLTSATSKIEITIRLLSLAGLPPLSGFRLKWLVLSYSLHAFSGLSTSLLLSILLILYFYLQMVILAISTSIYTLNSRVHYPYCLTLQLIAFFMIHTM